MNLRPRLMTMFGLVPTVFIAALSVYRPASLAMLEQAVYDIVLRATPTRPPSDRVVIVDVDDRSLKKEGQWPWRRDVMGRLVSSIRSRGAAVVALDVMFPEADRYEGNTLAPDTALAEALRPGRVVLGYGMKFDRGSASAGCVLHPVGLVLLSNDDSTAEKPYYEAAGAVCSLEMLVNAAGASGFLNAAPDPDGRLRRAPVLLELDGRVYPSLGLAAVSAITGVKETALRVSNVNTTRLLLSRADPSRHSEIPLDGKSNLLLRYRGKKGTFPYFSATDVLSGRVTPDIFRDKLVLIGTTALGTREVVSTPLDTLFTGVEVQATIADNLLQQDFVRRPENAVFIELLVVLAFGIGTTMLVSRGGHASGAAGVLAGVSGSWTFSIWLLSTRGEFLSPLFPTMSLAAALVAAIIAGLTVERRRADRARKEKEASKRLMVQTLLSLTEIKDAETGKHSRRTQAYTRVLAQELAGHPDFSDYLTPERIDLLATLAPLHDIGKVGVPDSVLNKPGALTPEELVEMRKHPVHGRDVIVNAQREAGIRDDESLNLAKDIVYTHHEKWDGSGYPEGLKGSDIPIAGRVMAIVDVYDAVLTRRLYAPSLSQADAIALIVKGRGTHFDPAVVDAFLRVAPVMQRLSESSEP
ncbi:MAG TPA: CHASE2 domain-containing protein [Vicinamibacterales bacterium]|nr:CHASE2 domain-containing protein [Vicinamibacterales bacterium]